MFLFILPFPHTVALRLLCLFAAIVIAIAQWRRLKPPPFPLKAPILIWAAVVLASLGFAVDLPYSIGEVKNELGYTLIAFASLFALTRDESRLRLLCLPVAAGFVVISLSALAGYAWYGEWRFGMFYGGVGTISNYFITAAPVIALAAVLWKPSHAGTLLAAAAGLLLCAGLVSGQRSLWPALGVQIAVGCLWLWRAGHLSWSVRRAGAIALLVLGLVAAGLWASEQLRTPVAPELQASIFDDARPRHWLALGRHLLEHPLQGGGFGQRALAKAYPELVPPDNPTLWHAHNLVLNYGLYAGVPGIVAVLILFAAMFARFWRLALAGDRTARLAGLAGAVMVAGVFARNTFNDFFIRDGALLFWGLAGMLLGFALRRIPADSSRRPTGST